LGGEKKRDNSSLLNSLPKKEGEHNLASSGKQRDYLRGKKISTLLEKASRGKKGGIRERKVYTDSRWGEGKLFVFRKGKI